MANLDFPRGLVPVGHLTGGEIKSRPYIVTTGEVVTEGEILKVVAGGTVEPSAADNGIICVGVAAEYVSDSGSAGGKVVQVYDDPNIIFLVQGATGVTPAAIDVFSTTNHVACTSTGKLSNTEVDMGGGAQLKVIGLDGTPGNAWGANADLLVIFNEHLYKAAVAGV